METEAGKGGRCGVTTGGDRRQRGCRGALRPPSARSSSSEQSTDCHLSVFRLSVGRSTAPPSRSRILSYKTGRSARTCCPFRSQFPRPNQRRSAVTRTSQLLRSFPPEAPFPTKIMSPPSNNQSSKTDPQPIGPQPIDPVSYVLCLGWWKLVPFS